MVAARWQDQSGRGSHAICYKVRGERERGRGEREREREGFVVGDGGSQGVGSIRERISCNLL